jgi:hypothetical protein
MHDGYWTTTLSTYTVTVVGVKTGLPCSSTAAHAAVLQTFAVAIP